jgi:hypothetical protein
VSGGAEFRAQAFLPRLKVQRAVLFAPVGAHSVALPADAPNIARTAILCACGGLDHYHRGLGINENILTEATK